MKLMHAQLGGGGAMSTKSCAKRSGKVAVGNNTLEGGGGIFLRGGGGKFPTTLEKKPLKVKTIEGLFVRLC